MAGMQATRGKIVRASLLLNTMLIYMVCAYPIPEKGSFVGVIHISRWGVAKFYTADDFYIDKALLGTLTPYNDKRVELQVLSAHQLMNPGPATIYKIGQINCLNNPSITVATQIEPSIVMSKQALNLLITLKNGGFQSTKKKIEYVWLNVLAEVGNLPSHTSMMFSTGNSGTSGSPNGVPGAYRFFSSELGPGLLSTVVELKRPHKDYICDKHLYEILLSQGDSLVVRVPFRNGVAKGKYEIATCVSFSEISSSEALSGSYKNKERNKQEIYGWIKFDVY